MFGEIFIAAAYIISFAVIFGLLAFVEMGPHSTHRRKVSAIRRETEEIERRTAEIVRQGEHDRAAAERRRVEDEIAWAEKMFSIFADRSSWNFSKIGKSITLPGEKDVAEETEAARRDAIRNVIDNLQKEANLYPAGSWQRARLELKVAELERRAKEA